MNGFTAARKKTISKPQGEEERCIQGNKLTRKIHTHTRMHLPCNNEMASEIEKALQNKDNLIHCEDG